MARKMDGHQVQEKIASFDQWHYQFDLAGQTTPIFDRGHVNRHTQRRRYFFDPVVEYLGGSLQGRRVLDLGCNAGWWSLLAIEAGAEFVHGVDGRSMHFEQANFVFEVLGIDSDRYRFDCCDVHDFDYRAAGRFDVVLCLGLLYHVSDPIGLIERIASTRPEVIVIDTTISRAPGAHLELYREPSIEEPRHAIRRELVIHPTAGAVVDLCAEFGYAARSLRPSFSDYTGAEDYRLKRRRGFICVPRGRRIDNTHFDVEDVSSLRYQADAGGRWALRTLGTNARAHARRGLGRAVKGAARGLQPYER